MAEWFKPVLPVIMSLVKNLGTLFRIVDVDCEFEPFLNLVFKDSASR